MYMSRAPPDASEESPASGAGAGAERHRRLSAGERFLLAYRCIGNQQGQREGPAPGAGFLHPLMWLDRGRGGWGTGKEDPPSPPRPLLPSLPWAGAAGSSRGFLNGPTSGLAKAVAEHPRGENQPPLLARL